MEPIRGKQEIIDPSYRYKMPVLAFQQEKTKTCITNLEEIAKSLKISGIDLIVAFFKKKLSIAIAVKKGRVIISNDINTQKVQEALYEFIEYVVLCKTCRFPELDYDVKKNNVAVYCRSCGKTDSIEENQYTDKVIKLMVTHLNPDSKGGKKKGKREKRVRKSKKESTQESDD